MSLLQVSLDLFFFARLCRRLIQWSDSKIALGFRVRISFRFRVRVRVRVRVRIRVRVRG